MACDCGTWDSLHEMFCGLEPDDEVCNCYECWELRNPSDE